MSQPIKPLLDMNVVVVAQMVQNRPLDSKDTGSNPAFLFSSSNHHTKILLKGKCERLAIINFLLLDVFNYSTASSDLFCSDELPSKV